MKTLPYRDIATVRPDPERARALKALDLHRQGMTDRAIARQMTSELPHGSKLIITESDVWRMLRTFEKPREV